MSLSRAAIVDQLKEIVGADRVITDETVLKKNSIDRFRKFPDIHGIYTLPIPAAALAPKPCTPSTRAWNIWMWRS
jgi:alkyldihydroxyacetonephosphate synthase